MFKVLSNGMVMPDLHLDYRNPEWVAEQLGIDKNAVYRYLDEGVLPGLRLGRKWLISESTLVEQFKREEREQTELRRLVASIRASADEFMGKSARLPFTAPARRALEQATEESVAASHNYIGQEHFLLAFARDPECTAARILTNLQFDNHVVEDALPGPGDPTQAGGRTLTRRALTSLELALAEWRRRHDANVGTEHLLLGIVLLGEGFGFDLLKERGIGIEQIAAELANLKGGQPNVTAPAVPNPDGLTERELAVLRLVASGKTNSEIAETLAVSTATVSRHINNILGKTGRSNRTELSVYAAEHGLLD